MVDILNLFSRLLVNVVNSQLFIYFMGCFVVIWALALFNRL